MYLCHNWQLVLWLKYSDSIQIFLVRILVTLSFDLFSHDIEKNDKSEKEALYLLPYLSIFSQIGITRPFYGELRISGIDKLNRLGWVVLG